MFTLILNGSPRPEGDVQALLHPLKTMLNGEVEQIDCYHIHLAPCTDCRYCVTHQGCAIQDDMVRIDALLRRCDRIIAASPVFFSLPTPPLLDLLSRMQAYFCARHFQHSPILFPPKLGGIVLCGGGNGSADPALRVMKQMLKAMNVRQIGPIVSNLHTDRLAAKDDRQALMEVRQLADFLNAPQAYDISSTT